MRLRFNWWWAVAAYMVAIFVVSAMPSVPQPPVPGIDKPEHYIEYGGLALVALLAVRGSRRKWGALALAAAAVAIASAYGVTDEYHQRFVTNRHCDALDWVADTLGAITAVTVATVAIRYAERKKAEAADTA